MIDRTALKEAALSTCIPRSSLITQLYIQMYRYCFLLLLRDPREVGVPGAAISCSHLHDLILPRAPYGQNSGIPNEIEHDIVDGTTACQRREVLRSSNPLRRELCAKHPPFVRSPPKQIHIPHNPAPRFNSEESYL
jgi:hypothetical protein